MQPSSSSPLECSCSLPPIDAQNALFLDFDGTLAELAPQPEAVRIATDLVPTLTQLAARLNGALAIVSGRKLTELDDFLAPVRLPTAAEHGAQRRLISGEIIRMASPDLQAVIHQVNTLAQRHPGLRVEAKAATVALHYRHAPELEAVCRQAMGEAARSLPGLELLHGKYVLEIKPAGFSKGTAIAAFMAQAPFAGRLPLFAGDDATDEAGFTVVQQRGGCGIKVGEGPTGAHCHCPSPAALRQWLQRACRHRPSLPAPPAAQESTGRIRP